MKLSQKELSCIQITYEYELDALIQSRREKVWDSKKAIINALRTPRVAGWGRGPIIDWAVYAFLFPFRVLFLIASPVTAWIERSSEKRWIAHHAQLQLKELEDCQAVPSKNICALWRLSGCCHRMSIKNPIRIECLLRWLAILYAEKVFTANNLNERSELAWRNHVKAVNESFRGRRKPDHISFADGIDLVVEELGEELPPYE